MVRLEGEHGNAGRCRQGINSTQIRVGEKSILKKIGYYYAICVIYYNLSKKHARYEKPYTVNRTENSQIVAPLFKLTSLDRDLDSRPLPYQGLIH